MEVALDQSVSQMFLQQILLGLLVAFKNRLGLICILTFINYEHQKAICSIQLKTIALHLLFHILILQFSSQIMQIAFSYCSSQNWGQRLVICNKQPEFQQQYQIILKWKNVSIKH